MLTVFTPCYNRAGLLPRLYESLLQQTDGRFTWLIVDDGSTDGTKELIEGWKQEGRLPITYIYEENGGKMRAHNNGVRHCETALFVCVDSDDWLHGQAVERILSFWEDCREDTGIAGIVAHKGRDAAHTFSGAEFPQVASDTLGGLYRKGFYGETTLVFRTDVLKNFLFPEIEGEKYVPEDVVYDRIDREYRLAVLPCILTICELVEEGYTASVKKLREENPRGWLIYYEQKAKWAPPSVLRMKYISHYLIFSRLCGENVWKKGSISKRELLCALPGALLLRLAGKR